MKKEKNPYYDENDMLKVRPFSYKLNADNAEGSKEEDDKIILNTVRFIMRGVKQLIKFKIYGLPYFLDTNGQRRYRHTI